MWVMPTLGDGSWGRDLRSVDDSRFHIEQTDRALHKGSEGFLGMTCAVFAVRRTIIFERKIGGIELDSAARKVVTITSRRVSVNMEWLLSLNNIILTERLNSNENAIGTRQSKMAESDVVEIVRFCTGSASAKSSAISVGLPRGFRDQASLEERSSSFFSS